MTAKSSSAALKRILKPLTPDEARAFAKRAGSSMEYLRHITAGRRTPSCELALALAKAAGDTKLQDELCPGCAKRLTADRK